MAKVVIRSGGDWLTVSVDDDDVIAGHSASPRHWANVLRKVGADVVYADGDFCEMCSEWTSTPQKGKHGTICPECKGDA